MITIEMMMRRSRIVIMMMFKKIKRACTRDYPKIRGLSLLRKIYIETLI
jgi:hypothetical protein